MTMIRLSGLGATVFASAVLLSMGCDSGGSTLPATGTGTGTGTGTSTTSTGGAGSTTTATGGKSGTTTSSTGGAPTTTSTTTGTTTGSCPTALPTATGTLSVVSGYVTAGTYAGYGFAYKGDKSNATTCVAPVCGTTGCTPVFGTSALCAVGTVTADSTYNSVAGVGFNLKQTSAGEAPGSVAEPATITVGAQLDTATMAYARIQIVDSTGAAYCVKEGTWSSGTAIPIGSFNATCLDTTDPKAKAMTAGTLIQSVHILIPSDATADHPFNMCLTGVS